MSVLKAKELLVAAVKEIETLPGGVENKAVHGAYLQTKGALGWLDKYVSPLQNGAVLAQPEPGTELFDEEDAPVEVNSVDE